MELNLEWEWDWDWDWDWDLDWAGGLLTRRTFSSPPILDLVLGFCSAV